MMQNKFLLTTVIAAWLASTVPTLAATQKSFELHKTWVRSLLTEKNLRFRKINRASPVIYKKLVITANPLDGLKAYDLETGDQKWSFSVLNGVEVTPTIDESRLYVGALDGSFYCVNADTGQVLWSTPTRFENLSQATIHGEQVYFLNGSNTLFSLNKMTGAVNKTTYVEDGQSQSIRGGSRPLILGNRLVVGFSDGSLQSFDITQAQMPLIKSIQLNKQKKFKDLDSDPIVDNGLIYIMGFDDALYALTPDLQVSFRIADGGGYGQIALDEQNIYLPTSGLSQVSVYNKKTGDKDTSIKTKGQPTAVSVLDDKIVYASSGGAMHVLEKEGFKTIASFDSGSGSQARPLIIKKTDQHYQIMMVTTESNIFNFELYPKKFFKFHD